MKRVLVGSGIVLGFALVAGCTPEGSRGLDTGSLSSPEALYPVGVNRDDLRIRGSLGRTFLRETEPADEFARLTVREMVSLSKPRPSSYERVEVLDTPGVRHVDYVFFDSQNRVMYTARRTERG